MEDIDHICMGDILRAERNTPGSPWAEEIEYQIREGGLVRSELSTELLQSHISKALEGGRRKFILDGFPRKVDQAILYEKKVRYVGRLYLVFLQLTSRRLVHAKQQYLCSAPRML
jgi:UMP-CMP kinase